MARRHWLDPLARRLLIASGQLPPDPQARPARPAGDRFGAATTAAADRHDGLERDLLALKLAQNPGLRLRDADEVRHAAALGWRLDVNQATAADWTRLPGCTAERADLLARLRAGGVQLSGPEDLQAVLGLDGATLASWLPLLSFRWYGDWYGDAVAAGPTAVAVNLATAAELERLPGLTPERSQRLQRERRRAPFRDLAELGERLCLPAEVLESWIGRIDCASGCGPEGSGDRWGAGRGAVAPGAAAVGPGAGGSAVPGSGAVAFNATGFRLPAAGVPGSGATGQGRSGFAGPELPPAPRIKGSGPGPAGPGAPGPAAPAGPLRRPGPAGPRGPAL